MRKISYEELNKRLKDLYPDEDLEFIHYETMKKPAKVKCNSCGTIYERKSGECILKQKQYFCSNCCDTTEWKIQKKKFIEWLKSQTDFELVDDLSKIHNSQSHIKCKCTKCGLIQENKKIYDYYNNKKCFCTTKSVKKPESILQEELKAQGYTLLESYKNTDIPTLVKRNKCNHTFKVRIAAILKDSYYCPYCHSSKGEQIIKEYLDKNNIFYISQYKIFLYKKCFIDFYLPHLNCFIEFNGKQHYESVKHFGGEEALKEQKQRDLAVKEYCKENKIRLIEISYRDFNNINGILKEELANEGF